MSRVEVRPTVQVLRWAVERSGKPINLLESTFPSLQLWLAEGETPVLTLRQLEQFAAATHTPLGALFLEEPPVGHAPIPIYMTNSAGAMVSISPEFEDTLNTMKLRQLWLSHDLEQTGHSPLPFVGACTADDPPTRIAERMREALGLPESWTQRQPNGNETLRALRLALEHAGVMVTINSIVGNNTRRKLSVTEFRGFTLVDPFAPWLFLNGSDSKAVQLFTLAHAFAHVMLGATAAFDLQHMQPAAEAVQEACAEAAAEFLLPAEPLAQVWPQVQGEDDPYLTLARQFRVSGPVAARRACDLGYIGLDALIRYLEQFIEDEQERSSGSGGGGNFYLTQNQRVGTAFAVRVAEALLEGRLLYSEAYELMGLRGQTFHNYLQTLDVGGVDS